MVVKTLTTYKCMACGNDTYCMIAMVNNERPYISFVCPRGGVMDAVWVKIQDVTDANTP